MVVFAVLFAGGCGHAALRKSRAIANEDGQRIVAAIESHENAHGQYPPSLEAIDTGGARIMSMTYVRDGDGYTLVVGASHGRHGASCTHRARATAWDCRRWRT